MITFSQKGDFSKTNGFFEKLKESVKLGELDKYGKEGVEALKAATPVNTGKTADSWYYTIKRNNGSVSIEWSNSNSNDGVPIAILIQYGHGTRNGGYVEGRDFINPAMRPVFDKIADSAWREVTNK